MDIKNMQGQMATEINKVFNLIEPQEDFMFSKVRYPAYVGAWATGKSAAGIFKAMYLSEKYPGNLGVIFRKEYTDLRDSTLKDFEKYTGLKVNSQREVELANGSVIMFRHMEELNILQNLNLGWFWIEQAEELDSDEQFFVLFGRLRRKDCFVTGFITANTKGQNWIYRQWKLKQLKNSALYEAKTWDNAHNLPQEFIESLKTLEQSKPKIYSRFVMNSWEESDTVDVIIQPSWVHRAAKREIHPVLPLRKIASVDVSRYGDDKTVVYAIENNRWIAKEEWEKKSTTESTGRLVLFAKKHDINAFAVDEIGVGAGVADQLQELGYEVVMVNSSSKPTGNGNYYNKRAQIYDYGANLFENDKVELNRTDIDLIEQLSWARYKEVKSNGVYLVEHKDDIRKRFQRSPDNADAFLNGLWALQHVKPHMKSDRYKRTKDLDVLNPATV